MKQLSLHNLLVILLMGISFPIFGQISGEFIYQDPLVNLPITAVEDRTGGWVVLKDRSIQKIDSLGHTLWQKEIFYYWSSIIQANNNDYLALGRNGVRVLRCDTAGNLVWNKRFAFSGYDGTGFDLIQTDDGGFLILGNYFRAGTVPDLPTIVVKIDSLGNHVWTQAYDITGSTGKIIQGPNKSYYIGINSPDIWLARIDSLGNPIWAKNLESIPPALPLTLTDLVTTSDSSFALVGFESANTILLKFSSFGTLQWGKKYADGNIFNRQVIHETDDLGFLIGGNFFSTSISNRFGFLLRTEPNGNLLWAKRFGDSTNTSGGREESIAVFDKPGAAISINKWQVDGNDTYLVSTPDNNVDSSCYGSLFSPTFSNFWNVDVIDTTFAANLDSSLVDTTTTIPPLNDQVVTDFQLGVGASAAFSFIQEGLRIDCYNESANATSVTWDFGDGNSSTVDSSFHIYSAPGTYSLCLSAVGICNTDVECMTITLNDIDIQQRTFVKEISASETDGNYDYTVNVEQTDQGEYLLMGSIEGSFVGDREFLMYKLDSLGNTVWYQKSQSGFAIGRRGRCLAGNLYAGTRRLLNDYISICKLNESGGYVWDKIYEADADMETTVIASAVSGNYYIGASSQAASTGGASTGFGPILMKIDSLGKIVWKKGLSNSSGSVSQIDLAASGNVLISGSGFESGFIAEFNDAGTLLNATMLGDSNYQAVSTKYTLDGGIVVVGRTVGTSGSWYSGFILKLNAAGTVDWLKHIEDVTISEVDVLENGYILNANINFTASLIKIDNSGEILWAKSYEEYEEFSNERNIKTLDGGFIVIGSNDGNTHVIKTDSLGRIHCGYTPIYGLETYDTTISLVPLSIMPEDFYMTTDSNSIFVVPDTPEIDTVNCPTNINPVSGVQEINESNFTFQIFPNPSAGDLNLELSLQKDLACKFGKIEVLNLQGLVCFEESIVIRENELTMPIKVGFMAKGLYFIRVTLCEEVRTLKWIKS